ncbi:MAG: porin [Chromatiales bacterium]|nr:porin [Chromatiales bacterium]
MNKKLLALAVAASLAPAVSFADVSVSAGIQAEISDFDNNGSLDGIRTGDADESGGYSFLKFTGSEKLDNGWTAFALINFAFNPTGNAGLTQRDSFVGLKNDVVSLSVGTINSGYKKASVAYDPFLATSLQARGNGGMSGGAGLGHFGHSSYLEDVIEVGVNAGPVAINVQYIADEIGNQNGSGVEDGSYTGSLKYSAGAFEIVGAMNHAETASGDYDGYKIGGKFHTGDLTLAAQYESTELGVFYSGATDAAGGNNDDEAEILFGSATYKLGSITLAGWVANYEQDDLDGVSYSLGGFYNFSKRTRIHAGYRSTDLEGDNGQADVEEDVVALGIRFVL